MPGRQQCPPAGDIDRAQAHRRVNTFAQHPQRGRGHARLFQSLAGGSSRRAPASPKRGLSFTRDSSAAKG